MEPLLADGAEAVAWPSRSIRTGDVVAIRAAGRVTVHRVVARVGDRLVHQGDRASGAGVARAGEVVGRVAAAGGRFRRTPRAWLLLLGLMASHIIMSPAILTVALAPLTYLRASFGVLASARSPAHSRPRQAAP
jgi:hypothetical protein